MLFLCCSEAAGLAHVPYFNPHFFPPPTIKQKLQILGRSHVLSVMRAAAGFGREAKPKVAINCRTHPLSPVRRPAKLFQSAQLNKLSLLVGSGQGWAFYSQHACIAFS